MTATLPIHAGPLVLGEKELEHKGADGISKVDQMSWSPEDCWIETKFDGFRLCIVVADDGVHALTRSFKFQDGKLPDIFEAFAGLPVGTVIDGEVVALRRREDGTWANDFEYVQSVMLSKPERAAQLGQRRALDFVAFDITFAQGKDVRHLDLETRRQLLWPHIHAMSHPRITLSNMYECTQDVVDRHLELGLEGVMIKRRDSYYTGSKGWLKIKGAWDMDAVVVGFTPGSQGTRWEGKVGGFIFGQPFSQAPIAVKEHLARVDKAQRLLVNIGGEVYIVRGSCKCGTDALHEDVSANRLKYLGSTITVKHNGAYKDDPQSVRHPQFKRMRPDKHPSQVKWHDR